MTSFFAAYDALCEEGTATSVCRALDEVADISVPGKVFHSSIFQLAGQLLLLFKQSAICIGSIASTKL